MRRGVLRYTGLALVFCLLFGIFLVVTAPATWLAWGVARGSRGVVNLNAPTGGLWQGSAALVIHDAASPPRGLGQLSWNVQAGWLLLGRAQVELRLVGSSIDMHGLVSATYNSLYLDDVSADIGASYASALYPPAALFSPEGRVTLRAPAVRIQQGSVTGRVELTWLDAAASLTSGKVLGDYRLTLDGQGQSVPVKIDTLKGKLKLDGQGVWQPGTGHIQLSGNAAPQEQPSDMDGLLQLLGPDLGGGRRVWSIGHQLAPLRM
jgi:general secretion pathway protein N